MKFRSYNSELIIAGGLLCNIFNDIVIDRRTNQVTRDWSKPIDLKDIVQKKIEVPCIFGDRGIILRSLENESGAIKLPLFILESKGIKTDTSRQCDLHVDVFYQQDEAFSKLPPDHHLYKPYNLSKRRGLPIILDYELTMVTKYREDLDQMCTNWMVHMRPDIYVRWWHPRNKTVPLESEILWSQSINTESNTDYDPTKRFQWKATTSFSFKTWVFPGLNGTDAANPDTYGLIEYFNVYPMVSYPSWGGNNDEDLEAGVIKYPVYGDLYNRENAGFFAVDSDQEFYNDGEDADGIRAGNYMRNNVETSPSAVWYDPDKGVLKPGQAAIEDITLVGDTPTNLPNQSNPLANVTFKTWQDYISIDPLVNTQTMFKFVYFTGGYPPKAMKATPPSGDFLLGLFSSEIETVREPEKFGYFGLTLPTDFGSSTKASCKPEYSYDVKTKTLTITSKKIASHYTSLIQMESSVENGIKQTVQLENNEKTIGFKIVRCCDKDFNFNSELSIDEETNLNMWQIPEIDKKYQLQIEEKTYTNILREIYDCTAACWEDLELKQKNKRNKTFELKSKNLTWLRLEKMVAEKNWYGTLSVLVERSTWEENGISYTLLSNNKLYIVLSNDGENDDIFDWGIVDMPAFTSYFYPVWNTTVPNGKLVYGFACESRLC
jgi:hypothetical protein